jgi:H+-translocating diphosphatase
MSHTDPHPRGRRSKTQSGPSLNILIKLMAVESPVFVPFFATHDGIIFKIF